MHLHPESLSLSVAVSELEEMTTSTLQRQKAAFSTKLQHFKVMMARIGFAQVLIIAVQVISAKLPLLVHLPSTHLEVAIHMFSHASMTQPSIKLLIIDNCSFSFGIDRRVTLYNL